MGELPRAAAADFLSGLLIGHDLAGAAELFADVRGKDGALTIIAAPGLAQRYARVCAALGIPATTMDGAHASLAGLSHLYAIRFARGKSDAA